MLGLGGKEDKPVAVNNDAKSGGEDVSLIRDFLSSRGADLQAFAEERLRKQRLAEAEEQERLARRKDLEESRRVNVEATRKLLSEGHIVITLDGRHVDNLDSLQCACDEPLSGFLDEAYILGRLWLETEGDPERLVEYTGGRLATHRVDRCQKCGLYHKFFCQLVV